MSHGITETDRMFSVHEMPWHGLGNVLDEYPTREEAQQRVHPWEPVTEPVYRAVPYIRKNRVIDPETRVSRIEEVPDVRYEEVPGSQAVVRSDNSQLLGVTNDTLGLITNNELWDVVEAVGNVGTDIKIETAGSLRGGQDVWALLRLAEPIRIAGDPNGATLAFLALQNNHVGGGSFRAQALNTRIVCANTSAAADIEAKRNGFEFNFRHSSGVAERIEEAKAAVSMWRDGINAWQQAMEHLVKMPVYSHQITWFVEQFQPMPPNHLVTNRVRNNVEKARGELWDILRSQTQEGIHDTAFGLFQAGIEWQQHFRQTKGKDERSRMESHFRRSMLTNDGLRRSTLKLAEEAATAV